MGSVQVEGIAQVKAQRQGLKAKILKGDIVLEHSEKVAKRESGKYIWTRPRATSALGGPGKVLIVFQGTQSLKYISLVAV